MLLALTRLGASLKLFHPKQSSLYLPHAPQTYLPRTRLSTLRANPTQRTTLLFTPSPRQHYGFPFTCPDLKSTMFTQALGRHNATIPPPTSSITSKQQSLGSSFARNGPAPKKATSPLASGIKQNGAGIYARGSYNQGTKRTSSGLAKTLDFHEDMVNYPTLNIAALEKENDLPLTYNASARSTNAGLATALFDEDDFDSDVDLDVEDPATKGTVTYPKLPQAGSSESRDSGYQSRPPTAQQRIELDSSQPVPWSSSPLDHFKTPQKSEALKPRTKRAFLPWSQNQKAASTQEVDDHIESEEENLPPKKKHSTETKAKVASTPQQTKSQYLWNTTASGLKQQQKNLREQNKKQAKENDTSVDDLQEAVKKRKKNTIHRIFLSEEQQNVLNLVTEYKKSVFFTGSAGKISTAFLKTIC
jgi:ATP-dependent DNA helicase PIF1